LLALLLFLIFIIQISKQKQIDMAFKNLNPVYKIVAFTEAKRHGDINRIAEETGYTQSMVSKTLRGLRNNMSIVNKAYRLVKDRQTNLQKLTALA
jgi:predicted transcriptional regulator